MNFRFTITVIYTTTDGIANKDFADAVSASATAAGLNPTEVITGGATSYGQPAGHSINLGIDCTGQDEDDAKQQGKKQILGIIAALVEQSFPDIEIEVSYP